MDTASYFIRRKIPVIVTLLECTMTFDKCRYEIFFEKLLDSCSRGLIFVYKKQYAWEAKI